MAASAAAPESYIDGHTNGGSIPGAAALSPPPPPLQPPLPPPLPWPTRAESLYHSCFCEENVWHLTRAVAARLPPHAAAQLYVCFISNRERAVPVWCQRAAASPAKATVWDYHVLLVLRRSGTTGSGAEPTIVLDLDSTLPFPCLLADYRRHALLLGDAELPAHFRRRYRVVSAALFLGHFASDRSHMVDDGGAWRSPPPDWPCIVAAADGATNTLPTYLDFASSASSASSEEGGSEGGSEEGSEEEDERRLQHLQEQHLPQQLEEQHLQGRLEELEEQQHEDSGGSGASAEAVLAAVAQAPFGVVLPEPAFLRLFGLDGH